MGDDLPAGESLDRRTFLYGSISGTDYQKACFRPGRMKRWFRGAETDIFGGMKDGSKVSDCHASELDENEYKELSSVQSFFYF